MDDPTSLGNGNGGFAEHPLQTLAGLAQLDRNLLELLPIAVYFCDREGLLQYVCLELEEQVRHEPP